MPRRSAAPADQIDFIAEQTARIQTGDERPSDIRLANGEVVRSRCKVLADGGRMVTYGNVSDLVRSADEMAELAMKDALTGIYNRRHFNGRLDNEWKRFRRYNRPLSLMLLDIDHFKSINDRYGHDVGDQVIIAVARCCGAQTRNSDVVARIGGEEFAILLPETELADARIAAERLRRAVAAESDREQRRPDCGDGQHRRRTGDHAAGRSGRADEAGGRRPLCGEARRAQLRRRRARRRARLYSTGPKTAA